MTKLQAYKNYQPVQYDYVEELPNDWKLLPNIAIFQERIERGFVEEELLSVTIGKGVIRQIDVDIKKDSSNEDKSKYKLIKVGDIAYNKMRMWQGALGYSNYQGISSPAYVILNPKMKINPKYFHYMFRSGFYTNYSKRFSYGIVDDQLSLRYTHFKRMYSIVPPIETQNAIVEYLDRKTKKIQEFISKKERLIELLEEKRKIETQNFVTKGLVEKVDLKDTKTSWFGKIPKNWDFIKLKMFADFVSRGTSPNYVDGNGIPVISQAVFSAGFIDMSKYKYQKTAKIEKFKGQLFNNDVLLASTGGGVLGKSFLFNQTGDYIADGHVSIIRDSKQRFTPAFFFYILSINYNLIEGYLGQGSTNQTELQREWFRNMFFPFPKIQEQNNIVNAISKLNNDIDKVISTAKTEIKKIKEYQESLVTQIVTGQLNVPELNKLN